MKHTLSFDADAKKKTYIHSDSDGMHVTTEQNVDHILDGAKYQQSEWRPNSLIGNTQNHRQKVAEFPATIYYDLLEKFGQPKNNPKAWKKWLRENPYFRTTGGKL